MRAAVVIEPGPADAIEIIDVPTPQPGPGEIRIKVAAAGVNPVDTLARAGIFHKLGWVDQPDHLGLGWDVAGTVTAVGEGAWPAIGARVAAVAVGVDRPLGTYAEEVVVLAEEAAPVPDGLSLTDAATAPLNSLAALQAVELLGAADGQTLLVTGAAGGFGGYATAFAAARGWKVTGLARESDREFVLGSGAVELITSAVGVYDAVIDAAVLGDLALVADDGHYVGVRGIDVPDGGGRVRSEAVSIIADRAALTKILEDHAAGTLPARVHALLPLDQASIAHKAFEAGGARGRYLLIP
jgi:NADPH:quinone reductase-like Zn-dependent oxidoreductase